MYALFVDLNECNIKDVPVFKKTYLVFITSEGQFFEWNVESLGDTTKCTKNVQELAIKVLLIREICTENSAINTQL